MINYIKYLRSNSRGYWFKRKLFGWGWVPVKWQGWVFLAAWIGLFTEFFLIVQRNSYSVADALLEMLIPAALLIIILFLVCYGTGEKPAWSWGR